MKYCKQCETRKKDKHFYPNNNSRCKECISINNRNKGNTTTPNTSNPGYLYVITNPAWKGYYKIGQTVNLTKRLSTYQTSSPLRDFEYLTTVSVNDMNKAEKHIIDELRRFYEVKGEWIVASKAEHIIHLMENTNND